MKKALKWLKDEQGWIVISCTAFIIFVFALGYFTRFDRPNDPASNAEASAVVKSSVKPDLSAAEIHELVNNERGKNGLPQLSYDTKLQNSASDKCSELITDNTFEHITPDGRKPSDFLKAYIPHYKLMGENLAEGYISNDQVITAWINSPEHKRNILDPEFNAEGLAICGNQTSGRGLVIVEHFIDY